ncbi:unnamed protein product [Adineta ricciae]|uniref:Uncharacterized protein n=1 Tax=Adineta ricciae TaxID=249248 RepID=A0A814UI85_ADIRI|nr:unnamed protein product [Adineta ricciae]
MEREWSLVNTDAGDYSRALTVNHSWHPRSLTRKISDQNSTNNHHHQSTADYNDVPSSSLRIPRLLSNRISSDLAYDTDGALESRRHLLRHHHLSSTDYEHLVSPRSSVRRHASQSSKPTINSLDQHQLAHRAHASSTLPPSTISVHNHQDEDSNYESDAHRRHIRLSRRANRPSTVNMTHGARLTRPTASALQGGHLVGSPVAQPFRIIFMRHSERVNQALGPDWFSRAFRTNSYVPYDQNLPRILPKRRSDQAFLFDAPLTVNGLKTARLAGRALLSSGLIPDVCLSSTALRCVQTCERILTGMDRRDRIPIRIEPGLFECPHLNHKITDSFMTKREFMDNSYNIKYEYKALIPNISVPETLDDYFDRSVAVMRGILDRYGHRGGTVLLVTHAPGLLALTDALKGVKPNVESFYRTVSNYPPLAMYMAEYDGVKWRFSDQPFNLVPSGR